MKTWPKHPVIYEINTWVWLGELGRKYQRPVNLATIPVQEWIAQVKGGNMTEKDDLMSDASRIHA
jgi:hypothetical protein